MISDSPSVSTVITAIPTSMIGGTVSSVTTMVGRLPSLPTGIGSPMHSVAGSGPSSITTMVGNLPPASHVGGSSMQSVVCSVPASIPTAVGSLPSLSHVGVSSLQSVVGSVPSSITTMVGSLPSLPHVGGSSMQSVVGSVPSSITTMVGSLPSLPHVGGSSMQSVLGSIPSVSSMMAGVPYIPGTSFTMVPLQFATMDQQLAHQVTIQHLGSNVSGPGFAMQPVVQPVSLQHSPSTNIPQPTASSMHGIVSMHQNATGLHQNAASIHQNSANMHQNLTGMQQNSNSMPQNASDMQQNTTGVQQNATSMQHMVPVSIHNTPAGSMDQNILNHSSQNKIHQIPINDQNFKMDHSEIKKQELIDEDEASDEEDIHLCGKCKQKFTNIDNFLEHRKKCSVKSKKARIIEADLMEKEDGKCQDTSPHSPGTSSSKLMNVGKDYEVSDRLILGDGRTYTVTEAVQVSVPDLTNLHNNGQDLSTVDRATSVDSLHSNTPIQIIVDTDENVGVEGGPPNNISNPPLQSAPLSQRSLLGDSADNHHLPNTVTSLPSEVSCTLNMSLEGSTVSFPLQFQVQQNVSEHETLKSEQLNLSPRRDLKHHEGYDSVVTITKFPDFSMKPPNEKQIIKSSASSAKKETMTLAVVPKNTQLSNRKMHGCTFVGCLFSARYGKDLVRHMRKHTGEKPFSCDTCGKSFGRMDKLTRHVQIHTGNKPFCCGVCDYRTSERSTLKKHMRVHTDERPFQCQICPYSSKNSSQLTVHLRSHTGDSPFICQVEECLATFKTNSDLTRHLRIHTGEKPYKCDYCDHRVSIKSNLKNHIRANHRASEIYKCNLDICEYSTSSKMELKEHDKVHTNPALELKFVCPHCPYSSANRHKLARHVGDHTINHSNSFKCTYCSYSSKSQSLLSSHINKKHGTFIGVKEKTKQELVKPLLKGRSSVKLKGSKVKLKQNSSKKKNGKITNADSGDVQKKRRSVLSKTICKPNFVCPVCPAGFVRRDSLRSHIKQHQTSNLDDPALTAAVENYIGGNINPETGSITIVTSSHQPPGLSSHMTMASSSQHPVEYVLPHPVGTEVLATLHPSQGWTM